jgi:short-subunit dehydrogenase
MTRTPQSILITGASSGLGEALALAYAAPGITLFLSGRDPARLAAVGQACRDKGADTHLAALDVGDRAAMDRWVSASDDTRPLDLVIANAGLGGNDDPPEMARAIWRTNLDGVINTVEPALARMRPRKSGQIALMSSLASFIGVAGASAYCGSKAAVRVWGEGLRAALKKEGIAVSVICPGFVTTRMTENNRFPMPFLMDAPRAARIMVAGLAAGKSPILYPWRLYALIWLGLILPSSWREWLMSRFPQKDNA